MRWRNASWVVCMLAVLSVLLTTACTRKMHMRRTDTTEMRIPHDKEATPQRAALTEVALAEQYIESAQYEVALDRLQRALKLDPKSADAYTVLGLLNERINRPDQAQASYAKAAQLAPNQGAVLNNYGAWLCRSGHAAESDAWFNKALADPFYKTPTAALDNAAACALKTGKSELAETYYRKILILDPDNKNALLGLATLLYAHDDFLHARAFCERLLASSQVSPDLLDLAARIEEGAGDTEAARNYRKRIATEFPQYTPPAH